MEKSVVIFFKGDFNQSVAGVAVRYLAIANELAEKGWDVSIVGRKVPNRSSGVKYIKASNTAAVVKSFFKNSCVILHGGGPFVLLLAALMSMWGKRVLLDSFAPHWIELANSPGRGFKKRVKVAFNLSRLVWAAYFFDSISVGTNRQKDLVRGIVAPFMGVRAMSRIKVVTGGCDIPSVLDGVPCDSQSAKAVGLKYKQNDGVVDFGWLGGVWPWFDVDFILESFIRFSEKGGCPARLHFFGVDGAKKDEMLRVINRVKPGFESIYFHPWVNYSERFSVWQGIDCAVVWSSGGLENDYASRTRNFDCITLGIPVIQNEDSFWGSIITLNEAGIVVSNGSELEQSFLAMSDAGFRARAASNISVLQERFKWSKIAEDYLSVFYEGKRSVSVSGIFMGLIVYPLVLFNLILVGGDGDD